MKSEISELLDRYVSEDTNTFRDFPKLEVNTVGHEQRTPLHLACSRSAVEDVEILLRHGADVNAKDDVGHTPLHTAVFRREVGIVRLLLAAGADPAIVSQFEETPLTVAGRLELIEIERLLREAQPT